jgi:hypothetical protein
MESFFNEFEPIQVSVNTVIDYSHLIMGIVF